jgi:hypothetical protein
VITYLKAGRNQQEQERYLDGTSRERNGVVEIEGIDAMSVR